MDEIVGKRCHFNHYRGTVRYSGQIPPKEGIWYGVEWDEPRGKHNGTVDEVSYFVCEDRHGSFVKTEKVDFGISFLEGLFKRYGEDFIIEESDLYVCGDMNQITQVKPVGFEKIETGEGALQKLVEAEVSDMTISSSGDMNTNIAKNIKVLKLSKNLFSSWEEILTISKALPLLQTLDVSDNYIGEIASLDKTSAVASVEKLYVNRMKLAENTLFRLLKTFCNVKHLHCCFNGLTRLSLGFGSFTNLEVINFEGNELTEWDDIMQFSRLPHLNKIILNENKMARIKIEADGEANFPSLNSLSLKDNLINNWVSVNQLNKIASLKEIRFRGNPLTNSMPSLDARLEIIARLRHLKTVNGSAITLKERQTAEITYLKKYAIDWQRRAKDKTEDNSSLVEFDVSHPGYLLYVKDYGPPAASVPTVGSSLKDKLIFLNFTCDESTVKKDTAKIVPVTLTVQQLKSLLQRLFKIKRTEQQLYRVDAESQEEILLGDNLRQLSFYSFLSNDLVIVRK